MRRKPPKAYSYLRFSTADQIRGDSLRRQASLAKEWCQRNRVELVEDYRDLGVSAFHGTNADRGALRAFLKKVEAGEIEKGSYLIVESLDRLSRTAITDALQMFLGIINSGVVVVTLVDEKVYDRDRINDGNFTDLIISLTILSRANEESRTKSKRLAAAWSNKRDKIGQEKLTAVCVGWLQLKSDRKSFRLIADRVRVVREIYEMAESGKGTATIVKDLNRRNIPTFGRSKGWHITFVKKILGNRAVIGEFTPTVKRDGKPVPLDPIADYYPAIISKTTFANVQRLRQARPSYSGRGQFNMFSRIAFDKATGAPVSYVNKNRAKGWHYLCCNLAMRGMAPYKVWQYDDFLGKFLFVCEKASERRMRPSKAGNTDLELARTELGDVEEQIGNLVRVLSRGYVESVETQLRLLESRKAALKAKIKELDTLKSSTAINLEGINWHDMNRLKENIRATVKRITIDAAGKWFRTEMLDGAHYTLVVRNGAVELSSNVEPKLRVPADTIQKVVQGEHGLREPKRRNAPSR